MKNVLVILAELELALVALVEMLWAAIEDDRSFVGNTIH